MILEGRQLVYPCDEDREVPRGVCILCGDQAEHVNDGGDAWLCHDDKGNRYLYHAACDHHGYGIWRCGCIPDYIENAGPTCCHCGKPRSEAEPYCWSKCPACGHKFETTDRVGYGNQSLCQKCGCDKCEW